MSTTKSVLPDNAAVEQFSKHWRLRQQRFSSILISRFSSAMRVACDALAVENRSGCWVIPNSICSIGTTACSSRGLCRLSSRISASGPHGSEAESESNLTSSWCCVFGLRLRSQTMNETTISPVQPSRYENRSAPPPHRLV